MMTRMLTAVLVAWSFGSCLTQDAFYEMVDEARACEAGDTCACAGSSQCTCLQAVNASEAESINSAADHLRCGGMMVECAPCENPTCGVDGLCVAEGLYY